MVGCIFTILGSSRDLSLELLISNGSELSQSQALEGDNRESKLFSSKSLLSEISRFSSRSILTKVSSMSLLMASLKVDSIGFFILGFVTMPLGDIFLCRRSLPSAIPI